MSMRLRKEAILQEKMWRKCETDEVYFLSNFWKIRVPGRGTIPFELYDVQKEALGIWAENRYTVSLKARQIGWSTLIAAHQFWSAYFHPDREILDISRGERESIDLLKKSKTGHQFLPVWMLERGPKLLSDHQQIMSFDNGSIIKSLPSATDPARGSSAYEVMVDEWAFLNDPEGAWASIEPVADIGGWIRGLSTANGSGNFFHNLWLGAEAQTNEFIPMFYGWDAVPGRDKAWYESKKRSMSSWQLAQEYPSNPEEAFIKSGRPVFDYDLIKGFEAVEPRRGYLHEIGA